MTAAAEHQVRSPLLRMRLSTKPTCVHLAAHWGLPVWDKPASPCLSSRIAYGEEVTPERVAMIDAAEQYLRSLGLRELRVRYHKGDLARIGSPARGHCRRSASPRRATNSCSVSKQLGFKYRDARSGRFPLGKSQYAFARRAIDELGQAGHSGMR